MAIEFKETLFKGFLICLYFSKTVSYACCPAVGDLQWVVSQYYRAYTTFSVFSCFEEVRVIVFQDAVIHVDSSRATAAVSGPRDSADTAS